MCKKDDRPDHAAGRRQAGRTARVGPAYQSRPCSIVNVKPGRVGGYLEARRIHDVCAAHGIPVWCGGMLETGLGRAANVALAALPNFTLPGDTSASDRYYRTDITRPFVLDRGHLEFPPVRGWGSSRYRTSWRTSPRRGNGWPSDSERVSQLPVLTPAWPG